MGRLRPLSVKIRLHQAPAKNSYWISWNVILSGGKPKVYVSKILCSAAQIQGLQCREAYRWEQERIQGLQCSSYVSKIFYFGWSPPWHVIFLSDILPAISEKHSIGHSIAFCIVYRACQLTLNKRFVLTLHVLYPAFFLTLRLAFYLAIYLAFNLEFYLTWILTFNLAHLAFHLAQKQGSGVSTLIRSPGPGCAHRDCNLAVLKPNRRGWRGEEGGNLDKMAMGQY